MYCTHISAIEGRFGIKEMTAAGNVCNVGCSLCYSDSGQSYKPKEDIWQSRELINVLLWSCVYQDCTQLWH